MVTGSPPRTFEGYMSDEAGLFSHSVIDVMETVPDLTWPSSNRTYGLMRTDPTLESVLNAYVMPLIQAPKHVDPAGCRSQVVQLIADDLGLPVLGKETGPGPARRRGVNFSEHFRLALLNLTFGHMPFAQRYEIIDGQARLAELSERMPMSIMHINLDDAGQIDEIIQFGADNPIPAEHLVWYAHKREGAAWQGRSMLRSAYGPWLLKHEMWRVLATSSRRFGMGIPQVTAPPGGTPAQVTQAAQLAAAIRVGDQSGIGLPDGFKVDLKGVTGSVPDTLGFIKYLDQQMAQMALASVLNLDNSPNGSRALGATFIDLLLTSLNAIADEISAVLTKLAIQMVTYNFGESENVPRIVIGDVGSRPEATAESISLLMNAGAIAPDPELEAWVRERWTLPQREVTAPPPPTPMPVTGPEMPPQPTGSGPVQARSALRMAPTQRIMAASASLEGHRSVTEIEAKAGLNPKKLNAMWESELTKLIRKWRSSSKDQNASLSTQIESAIRANDPRLLATIRIDTKPLEEILATAMEDVANESADLMASEIESQGVALGTITLDLTRTREIAATIAPIVGSGYANAAGRQALRLWTPGSTPGEISGSVEDYLNKLSDSYLELQLGNALSMAQNDGRVSVLDAAPSDGRYFASEVLDTNTCEPCQEIDGTDLGTKEEAAAIYAAGGYVDCLGGLRCRGIFVAVYD